MGSGNYSSFHRSTTAEAVDIVIQTPESQCTQRMLLVVLNKKSVILLTLGQNDVKEISGPGSSSVLRLWKV